MKRNLRMLLILGLAASAATPVAGQAPGDKLVIEPQAVLEMEHAAIGDRVGQAVALSGEVALLGCPFDSNVVPRSGSVCIFVRDGEGWLEQGMLVPSDPSMDSQFGWSVALSGNTALVGAPGAASRRGAAYVFVRDGEAWIEQAKLVASDPEWGDEFGWSVAVTGNTALVGARFDDVNGKAFAGSAYVFLRTGSTWSEEQKLIANDGLANDQFGHALAVSGNTAVIGAPWASPVATGTNAGAAYVFTRMGANWTLQGKLLAPGPAAGENLGWSVAADGEIAVAGARRGKVAEVQDAGLARVFVREGNGWAQQAVLAAADPSTGEEFGRALVMETQTVLVGVPFDRIPEMGICGSACVFGFVVTAWTDLGYGLAGVAGVPTLAGIGTLEAGSPGELVLADAAGDAPAMLYIALTADPTPFKGGLLVPFPPELFVPVVTGFDGGLTLGWDAWPAGVPPGTSFYFQYAIGDEDAVMGVALSNALEGDAP